MWSAASWSQTKVACKSPLITFKSLRKFLFFFLWTEIKAHWFGFLLDTMSLMEGEGCWHSANTINGLIGGIDSKSKNFVRNYSIFPQCRCNYWLSLSDSMLLHSDMGWTLWGSLWKKGSVGWTNAPFPPHAKAALGVASCNLGNDKVNTDGEMCTFFLAKLFCATARLQRQMFLCFLNQSIINLISQSVQRNFLLIFC